MPANPTSFWPQSSDLIAQQLYAQQLQEMGQSLMQQGAQPMSASLPQNLAIIPKMGALNGLTKAAQTMLGAYLQKQSIQKQADVQGQQYANMLNQNMQTAGQLLQGNQQPQQQPAQPSVMSGQGENGAQITSTPAPQDPGIDTSKQQFLAKLITRAQMGDPTASDYLKEYFKAAMPTEKQRDWNAGGLTQQSLGAALQGKAIADAQVKSAPGETLYNPLGGLNGVAPSIPQYTNATTAPGNPTQVTQVTPIKNAFSSAANLKGTETGAVEAASAPYKTVQAYDPKTQTPVTVPLPRVLSSGGIQSGPATGQVEQIGDMQKRFGALQASNSEANNTESYLQSIKQLYDKAATGPQSDKLNYMNGLLGFAGVEKAQNEVDARALMDKYKSQIISRLAASVPGLSTDAGKELTEAAYPGAQMGKNAGREAVDNLIGAVHQTQAKMRLLAPYAMTRDAQGYVEKEIQFDQAADQRLFQLKNMSAEDQAKYIKKLDPGDAQKLLMGKLQLEKLGAF